MDSKRTTSNALDLKAARVLRYALENTHCPDRQATIPRAQAITDAIARRFSCPRDRAYEIGFHLVDWTVDGMLLMAVSLRPEDFSEKEIGEVVEKFVRHAPEHIAAASKLCEGPTKGIFDSLSNEPSED